MARITWLAALHMLVVIGAARTYAQEQPDSTALVERIMATWHSRQNAIKTLRASATVDSFISKGYASSIHFYKGEPIPTQDVWYRGQWQSWEIDLAARRFRKEFCKAMICADETARSKNPLQIVPMVYHRLLFSDDKATLVLRPEDGNWGTHNDGFRQHVLFDYAPGFVIWPEDLPLFWFAGGITGQWPSPSQMPRLDRPEEYIVHHRTRWHDRNCVILRVRNHRSRDSVREFWVDDEEPHVVYRSQIVRFADNGERVEQRTDIEYQEGQGRQVPVKWTYTEFWCLASPGEVFTRSETFTIQQIEINTPLDPDLFKVQLKPGMGVIYGRDRPGRYVVDLSGKLVECRSAEQQQRIASLAKGRQTVHKVVSVVVGLTVAIALSTAGWLAYRRLVRRKVGVAEQ
ncbi:MAG: hypothetical protein KatS3mg109_2370 [Pirellulaceae bacterium]|nr:MAG: hypothetical protein KatS3mg109_2370 [Pirellulaceae bacterium]